MFDVQIVITSIWVLLKNEMAKRWQNCTHTKNQGSKAGIPIHNRAGRKGTNMFDAVLGDFHIKLSNFHKLDEPHLFIQYFSNPPSLKFFCSMTSEHVERGTFY